VRLFDCIDFQKIKNKNKHTQTTFVVLNSAVGLKLSSLVGLRTWQLLKPQGETQGNRY